MLVGKPKLIVAGGSSTGMYVAIAAARSGYDVTVVEKFGEVASRRTIFNLAPTVADSLDRIGGTDLTSGLQVIKRRMSDDTVNGQHKTENFGDQMVIDSRRELSARAIADGFTGVDSRPWSRVQIGGLENHMREYSVREVPGITFRYDTSVDAVRQNADRVQVDLTHGPSGTKDTIEGAYLVSATGGRNVLGIQRQLFPEQAHFVGGLFEPLGPDELARVELRRVYRDGADLDPSTHALNPAGRGWATVSLPGTGSRPLPHTLIWAQVAEDAKALKEMDPELLKRVVRDRAAVAGLGDLKLLPDSEDPLLTVGVRLGLLRDAPAAEGRVLLGGDELFIPYFPTSTGASHGLGTNGPLLATTLDALRGAGADRERILDLYSVRAKQEAADVMRVARPELLEDLGMARPAPGHELDDLGRAGVAGDAAR